MVLALYWVSRYRVFMTTNPPPNQTHNADSDAGLNLDLPYIDYPTGWAIQRGYDLDHHDACSAKQTSGAFLCDCNGLIYKWADLKWKHERSKAWDAAIALACDCGDFDGHPGDCAATPLINAAASVTSPVRGQ